MVLCSRTFLGMVYRFEHLGLQEDQAITPMGEAWRGPQLEYYYFLVWQCRWQRPLVYGDAEFGRSVGIVAFQTTRAMPILSDVVLRVHHDFNETTMEPSSKFSESIVLRLETSKLLDLCCFRLRTLSLYRSEQ